MLSSLKDVRFISDFKILSINFRDTYALKLLIFNPILIPFRKNQQTCRTSSKLDNDLLT
jgi:hypothetical protein